MNINQRQQVLDIIENIEKINIENKIIESYPDEKDLTKVGIGKYHASDLLFLLNKMISQLKSELENGLKFFLPFTENYSNDFGAVNLNQDLSYILNYLNSNQFVNIEPLLDRLIHYQIKNGFWDRSSVKLHPIDQDELKKQKTAITLNQKAITKGLEDYSELERSLKKKTKEFDQYINEKRNDISEISNLLENAKIYLNEINNLKANIQNSETEIKGISSNLSEKVESITVDISDYKDDYGVLKINLIHLHEELQSKITEAKTKLDKAKRDLEFVDGKREQIETLTGMAADGALGSKFDQRQSKLDDGLLFWKWAVPLMTIITGAWVVIVFKYLIPSFKEEWLNIIISILKTIPGFILLGFVFSQYKKERNLQEEYAFKSAVAMTLTAYSEMLSKADTENNISRQQMLLKSIEMVYNQPQIYTEKNTKISNLNTKDLKETLTSLTEVIKNIKN